MFTDAASLILPLCRFIEPKAKYYLPHAIIVLCFHIFIGEHEANMLNRWLPVLLLVLFFSSYKPVNGDGLVPMQIGEVGLRATIAMDESSRRQGLMGRQSMAQDEGMLLVYPSEWIIRLWMLNTYIPLDVGFFDRHGILVGITSMEPDGGAKIHTSLRPAKYALEMNWGWFKHNKIQIGARLKLPANMNQN